MDLDTECIPLGHIQTYLNMSKSIPDNVDRLIKRVGIRLADADEKMQAVLNMDQYEMYRRAGIQVSEDGVAGYFVTPRQVLKLIDQAMDLLGMPYLGLPMGNLMTVTHHGMAGLAVVTQPTMLDSGRVLERFFRELFPPLELSVHIDGQRGWLQIDENLSLAPYTHFFIELNLVSFYNIFADLVGHDPRMMPDRLELNYPDPGWGHIYRRYFKCPVIFDAGRNALSGPSFLADVDMPLANRLMAMTAEKTLFENIPTRAIRMVPLRLRRLLVRYYGAFPSLENAARELGMSGRTLRRRLADDGTSYQQELNFVREKFAREYFQRGGTSITELAHLLGYADSSAFAKAFRGWTGISPSDFMQQQGSRPS
ncbi:MAG: AraC family transcriptional regulator [Oceanospirillaceae bacterium]|nr:AraC family transcriptional regulator [Oceanospirillaceae bacterium]|tara:strand:+ start:34483 stop:35586 length:1104 start_codon:yes stop_codon:yes gene_type:complete